MAVWNEGFWRTMSFSEICSSWVVSNFFSLFLCNIYNTSENFDLSVNYEFVNCIAVFFVGTSCYFGWSWRWNLWFLETIWKKRKYQLRSYIFVSQICFLYDRWVLLRLLSNNVDIEPMISTKNLLNFPLASCCPDTYLIRPPVFVDIKLIVSLET